MELEDLPKFRINEQVRYLNANASIVGCWWDEVGWRYELHISRGKNKGHWAVSEKVLLNGAA